MVFRRLVFELELARWRRASQRAQLWWRDDDARGPTPALDRLLGLATRYNAPLTLAVVPDREPERLLPVLEPAAKVTVSQHGVDHQNRREGASAGEFGEGWIKEPAAGEWLKGLWSNGQRLRADELLAEMLGVELRFDLLAGDFAPAG